MKSNINIKCLKDIKTTVWNNRVAAFASFSALLGFIFGSLMCNLSRSRLSEEIIDLFLAFNTEIADKTKTEIFSGIVLNGLIYYLSMLLLGGSIYGKKLCYFVTFIKMMGIGAVISMLYSQHGAEGFEYTLLIILPGKIPFVFSSLFYTVCCFDASNNISRGFVKQEDMKDIFMVFIAKSIIALLIFIFSWVIDFIFLIVFSFLFDSIS